MSCPASCLALGDASVKDSQDLFFFFLAMRCVVCRLLVPQPGMEKMLPTVEAWSPNTELPGKFMRQIFMDTQGKKESVCSQLSPFNYPGSFYGLGF